MTKLRYLTAFCGPLLLAACGEEPPPVSPAEFMENPRLLEATMVRCAQNRAESRYVADCINARDAVNRLEAAEERTRREGLEQQSERKRQALRRTQQAAAAARRLAIENQRRREEEEYLELFDQPPDTSNNASGSVGTSQPVDNRPSTTPAPIEDPASDQAPEATEEIAEPKSDLGEIREELKRRQQSTE